MVSDFFINICILTALFFSYLQLRWHTLEKHLPQKAICAIDGVAAGIMGNLMMYYSIQVNDLTLVDLRHIPVLMILLISGVRRQSSVLCSLLEDVSFTDSTFHQWLQSFS